MGEGVWIELGRVGAPFGVRGWIRVDSYTDPPERLFQYRQWALRLTDGSRQLHRLSNGHVHATGLVAQLEGLVDRAKAAALTGAMVEVERAELPPLGECEYYRADLAGFRVRNLEGAELGVVSHFVDAPAGAVMVAKEPGGREHWVLAGPKHLRKVDAAAREIVVDWPVELE